jgi:outer membrane protein TolC
MLEIVLGRSPDVRKAALRVVEHRARLREANLSASPEFEVITRFYPLGFYTGLVQSVLGGFWEREERMRQAEAGILSALAEYARVRGWAAEQALQHYLGLLEAEELIPPLEEELKLREARASAARNLLREDALPPAEAAVRQREADDLRLRLVEARGLAVTSRAALNGLMGRPAVAPLTVARREIAADLPEELEPAIAEAHRRRRDIAQAGADAEEAAAAAEVRDFEMPRLDLRAGHGYSARRQRKGDFLEGLSVRSRFWTPVLLVPLEEARDERSRATVRQLQMEMERLQALAAFEVADAHQKLLQAREEARMAETRRGEAEASLRAARAAQRWGGPDTLLPATDLEIRAAEARRIGLARRYGVQRASLKLRYAMGVLPERVPLAGAGAIDRSTRAAVDAALPPDRRMPRALWIRDTDILEPPGNGEFVLDVASARGITAVFLVVSPPLLADRTDDCRRFLAAARLRGIAVQASFDASTDAEPRLDAIVRFHREGPEDARFAGVRLAVDPRAHDDWKAGDPDGATAACQDRLAACRARLRDAGIPLGADIPADLDDLTDGPPTLIERILDLADDVAVTAPGPTADDIRESVRQEVETAARADKGLWLGVSADPARLPPGFGATDWEALAADLERGQPGQHTIRGIAIDDYDAYRRLLLAITTPP